jgi:hypothetical protein
MQARSPTTARMLALESQTRPRWFTLRKLPQPLARVAGDPDLGPLTRARDHVQARLCIARLAAHTLNSTFRLTALNSPDVLSAQKPTNETAPETALSAQTFPQEHVRNARPSPLLVTLVA